MGRKLNSIPLSWFPKLPFSQAFQWKKISFHRERVSPKQGKKPLSFSDFFPYRKTWQTGVLLMEGSHKFQTNVLNYFYKLSQEFFWLRG